MATNVAQITNVINVGGPATRESPAVGGTAPVMRGLGTGTGAVVPRGLGVAGVRGTGLSTRQHAIEMKTIRHQEQMNRLQRRFNFELLGTMFFGMAIERTFGGMVKNVLRLTGVFEVLTAMLITLLMPIIKPIAKIIIGIAKWIMALPKEVKILIGALIVGLAVFGMILFIVSQIALGVASFILLLSATGAVASVAAIAIQFGAVLAAVVAISAAVLALGGTLRDVLSVLLIVGGLAATLTGHPYIGVPAIALGVGGLATRPSSSTNVNITQTNYGGISTPEQNRQKSWLDELGATFANVGGAFG